MLDFEVNYKAGKRLRGGESLYQVEDGHLMFKYLPSSALLYLPLSLLPLNAAKAIWYFIVAFCLCSLVYISTKILPSEEKKSVYLLILPPLILIKFFLRELQLGQINALVTMILLFMIWFLIYEKNTMPSQKDIHAGLLWGVAIALKPYALIFLPYFLLKKKWKSLLSGVGFLFLALLIPSVFYGFRGNIIILKEWITTLFRSTQALLDSQVNISIIAFFMKWTGNRNTSLLLSGLVIAILAFLVLTVILIGRKIDRAPVLECSIILILIPLISPLGWDYTLLMSVLGVTIIIHNFSGYSKFWRGVLVFNLFIITFALFDIMGRDLYERFMSWSVITINFLILIGYLMHLRFRKIC
ncbi:MAG: glycosyltransferase family 87 protein [Candidatus Bathyarchaeota archaeon]|nr:glycosyltransferase family 87 protein [Candidatus Bathyarchaeota archaeon]